MTVVLAQWVSLVRSKETVWAGEEVGKAGGQWLVRSERLWGICTMLGSIEML